MPKYELAGNRHFYRETYYYSNHIYGVKRKVLKIMKINMLMCTGLSFIVRFHTNVTNIISKTAKNY